MLTSDDDERIRERFRRGDKVNLDCIEISCELEEVFSPQVVFFGSPYDFPLSFLVNIDVPEGFVSVISLAFQHDSGKEFSLRLTVRAGVEPRSDNFHGASRILGTL